MTKDPVLKILDESFSLLEADEPRIPKIAGYSYPQYVSVLMFVDAFADAAVKDSPTTAEKFQVAGRGVMENVLDYFDEVGLDVADYADEAWGLGLIDKINEIWGENFSVEALIQYDKDALTTLVLIAIGHDVDLSRDVKTLLKEHNAKVPTASMMGVELDDRRYRAAYRALDDILGTKTESRDIMSEAFLDFFKEPKKKEGGKVEQRALKLIETILKQLKLKYHLTKERGKEGTVFRHHLTIDKKHYILKSYVIHETEYLGSVLWDEHEDNFFVVAVLGYLKDYYAMIAFGRQRLKAWMEKRHGST